MIREGSDMAKTCGGCVFSTGKIKLHCTWEKHFLPPPVFRARNWGKDAPETWDEAAESCGFYKARDGYLEKEPEQ